MHDVVRVKMENGLNTVTQSVEIVTCQCQYLVTDKRTGEQSEMTFRFIVPDGTPWISEISMIADNLGYTLDHVMGTYYLHKTWVDASDLYMEGEQTFG